MLIEVNTSASFEMKCLVLKELSPMEAWLLSLVLEVNHSVALSSLLVSRHMIKQVSLTFLGLLMPHGITLYCLQSCDTLLSVAFNFCFGSTIM